MYERFLKATQIEAIIDKLNACFASASNSNNQLENVKKTMNVVEKDLSVLEAKFLCLKEVDMIEVNIVLKHQHIHFLSIKYINTLI